MVSKPNDKKDCVKGDYANTETMPASDFYPEGSTPALTKDYSKASDADLTNGFTPQTRK